MATIDPDLRVIHILPGTGRKVISILVPGDGFIAYHWQPVDIVTFGHGVTREEAVMEVAEKVRRRGSNEHA